MATMISNQRVCRQSSRSLFCLSLNSLFINAQKPLKVMIFGKWRITDME